MPKLRDLRFRAEYAAVRSAVAALRLLPIDAAASVVGSLAAWIAPWTPLHRPRAQESRRGVFPIGPPRSISKSRRRCGETPGERVPETLLLDRIRSDPSRLEIESRATFGRRLHEPRRQPAASRSTWETGRLVAVACGRLRRQIRRRLSLAAKSYLDRYLREMRSPFYSAGLIVKGRARRLPADGVHVDGGHR